MDAILEQINSAGKVFVGFAWPMLIQSSILIVVLLGLDLVLRKRIRAVFRYWMWMIVLVKLILPTALASPTSPAYWLRAEPSSAVTADLPIPSVGGGLETPARPVPRPPAEGASFQPAPASSVTWQGLVFVAWLAAVVTMTALLLQRALFVRGLVAQSEQAGDAMMGVLERCREQMRVRRKAALRLSGVATSPSVCGLMRPTILLPASLADGAKPEHIKSILLHELAHIKRGDLWVSFIQTIVQIIYIYNPLLWVANAVIRRVREQAVDETVLVTMGQEAEDYPRTLLHISRLACGRTVLSLQLIGVVESKKSLIGRIKHITSRPFPRSAKMGIRGFLIVVALAAVVLPMAKGQKPAKEDVSTGTESGEKSVTPLHEAVAAGDLKRAKSLIAKGADVNAKSGYGNWMPLHIAARYGHKDIAEALLSNGADVDAEARRRFTPLFYAASHGHKGMAKLLIEKGADVDVKSQLSGATPLYCASAGGHEEIVDSLLAKGADVNVALLCAARTGHLEATKLLLAKGANVNAKGDKGVTPLHEAARYCRTNVAELLITEGADVNAKDESGTTAAYTTIGVSMFYDQQQIVQMVNLLLAKGTKTDIHLAAFSGDLNKVKSLLEAGIDIDATIEVPTGRMKIILTPLCLAIMSGQKEVVRFLVSKGADVNATEGSAASPLGFALMYPEYEVVKLLIDNGADVKARRRRMPLLLTPLSASGFSNLPLFDWEMPIDISLQGPNPAVVQWEQTSDRSFRNTWPKVRDVIELLLKRGAGANSKGIGGRTLLIQAANAGLKDAVQLLLEHGADIDARDGSGRTALHYACWKNHKEVVEFLLSKRADADARDEENETALEVAERKGHIEIVALLRKHGAKK